MMVTIDPAERARRRDERIADQQLRDTRAAKLSALAGRLGATLDSGDWLCAKRLTMRAHVCNSHKCTQEAAAGGHRVPDYRTFDHLHWMREPGGRWVLLTQPYHYDPVELTAWCNEQGVTWEDLCEPSPHGCGTHTVIIRGI